MIIVIDIVNLEKKYGEKIIFKDFELHINENEFVAVVGKSGQGKSSLLNILGLLDSDYKGEYVLLNNQINKLNEQKKARLRNQLLGFVFQNYNLLDDLNVIDNIYLPYCFSNYKVDNKCKLYITDIIKKLEIYDLCKQKVKYLSGGEKQRVAIARALALNPQIILADEPTGNLDAENTKVVLDFFREMKMSGKSIIMVTHDLNILNQCDEVIDLSGGQMLNDI